MNKIYKILLPISVLFFFSCSNFLDPYPDGNYPENEFWERQAAVQGLIGRSYGFMPMHYNNSEGFLLDGATDDAVLTSKNATLARLAVGAATTQMNIFGAAWKNNYQAIALVNKFLEDDNGLNTRYRLNDRQDSLVRHRHQGEAYALRAWYQWDLLKRFGGIGSNGQMLGFPIVTKVIDVYNDDLLLARNTYDECVAQIEKDCDSALVYLPLAYRDYLMELPTDRGVAGSIHWGRIDGITVKALKSLMYLTYASPLYNPTNDQERWKKAAQYAKEVMDFKLTVDKVNGGFDPKKGVDWTNPNFPGIIFASRFGESDVMERALYPQGFRGNAVVGPSQELVDAFPMKNGYPSTHPKGAELFDKNNPYLNRDPRFYSNIFYNGAQAFRDNNPEKPMYTFDTWMSANGQGKDLAGESRTSQTNYYVKKYIYMGLNWSDGTVKKSQHSKFFIRWAHMVLTFAEAANELEGPDGSSLGLSAKDAMKYLRQRETYDKVKLYADADPYLDEVAGEGKEAFRGFIRNERRLETCFEGIRFYDLRRWSTVNDLSLLNMPVSKAVVTKKNDNSFEYDYAKIEDRVYRTPFLPLPNAQVLNNSKLEQNQGW